MGNHAAKREPGGSKVRRPRHRLARGVRPARAPTCSGSPKIVRRSPVPWRAQATPSAWTPPLRPRVPRGWPSPPRWGTFGKQINGEGAGQGRRPPAGRGAPLRSPLAAAASRPIAQASAPSPRSRPAGGTRATATLGPCGAAGRPPGVREHCGRDADPVPREGSC